MAHRYLAELVTPSVVAAEERWYGGALAVPTGALEDTLGPEEAAFVAARDSFYLATVSESGWPYVQHRGGPPGFLKVLTPSRLGFPDYRGNRQLLSTGNLGQNDRVALFLMDYPNRRRLKVLGHARVESARERPELLRAMDPAPSTLRRI